MCVGSDCRKELDNLLRTLGLTGTRLATTKTGYGTADREKGSDVRDEDSLVLSLLSHIDPCTFGDCEDMRRILIATLAAILVDNSI